MQEVQVGDRVLVPAYRLPNSVTPYKHRRGRVTEGYGELWTVEFNEGGRVTVPKHDLETEDKGGCMRRGQRVRFNSLTESFYGTFYVYKKDIYGTFTDAIVIRDDGKEVKVKTCFLEPVVTFEEALQEFQKKKQKRINPFSCSGNCKTCSHREVCETYQPSSMYLYKPGWHEGRLLEKESEEGRGEGDVLEVEVNSGYEELLNVLLEALDQAQSGKGQERHSNGEDFEDQPICTITRDVGLGFPLGQAIKKATESKRLYEQGKQEIAERDLLGAINYLTACLMIMREEL